MSDGLHPSLIQALKFRGYQTPESIQSLQNPILPSVFMDLPDMEKAVALLRGAITREETVAIYADRDVDGLTGLAILARSLRTLGAPIVWGSPVQGRGLERAVLEKLISTGAKILILVDCGTVEDQELTWLAQSGIQVIVADHHRMLPTRPPAYAWIHPEAGASSSDEHPCGSVMAFHLASALWRTFIDPQDPERLDYFLMSHLDLVALGILADRVPITGANRAFVWHGLRRLAKTQKVGLASLLRFFRIKGTPVSVRQATWQIIPLLNAAGRLREPQWTANLLMTEDPQTARACIDALLGLNTMRRRAQDESVQHFEKTVVEQCAIEKDAVLVATACGLEPSVTGLAAQNLVQKYGRPAFLFVEQGDEWVGSGRGTPDTDLFAWIERHQELLVKFGGHQGAVGLTVRKADFPSLREGLLRSAEEKSAARTKKSLPAEARVGLSEANAQWWEHLLSLEPFGPGFEVPAFELSQVEAVVPRSKRSVTRVMLKQGGFTWPAELPESGRIPATLVAKPSPTPREDFPFQWVIQPE